MPTISLSRAYRSCLATLSSIYDYVIIAGIKKCYGASPDTIPSYAYVSGACPANIKINENIAL